MSPSARRYKSCKRKGRRHSTLKEAEAHAEWLTQKKGIPYRGYECEKHFHAGRTLRHPAAKIGQAITPGRRFGGKQVRFTRAA